MAWKTTGSLLVFFSCSILSGCGGSEGGGNQGGNQSGSLSVSLSNASPLVFPAQSGASITATLTRTGTTGKVTLSVTGLPNGATASVQSPGASNTGTVTVGAGTAPAGTYQAVVTASDGATLGSTAMTVTVGANTQVSNSVTGRLELTMSTSFQPAEWDYRFFTNFPAAVTPLGNLQAQHIRLQPISQGIPQKNPTTWDFSIMDAIIQPVLGVGDHSPEYQIGIGPPYMYDSSLNFVDPTYGQFTTYAQEIVHVLQHWWIHRRGRHVSQVAERIPDPVVGDLQRAQHQPPHRRAIHTALQRYGSGDAVYRPDAEIRRHRAG